MEQFTRRFPFHTRIQVAWGEMDALQHVNNVVYFRYFETARIDFFNQLFACIPVDSFGQEGMEYSSCRVKGLDIGLGEDAAASADMVDPGPGSCVLIEFLDRDHQELRDLVDKSTGTPGADTVHTHIRGNQLLRVAIEVEKDDLRVLTTEFDRRPGGRMQMLDGYRIGDDFLDEVHIEVCRYRATATTADRNSKCLGREAICNQVQQCPNAPGLLGKVAAIFR